MKVVHHHHEEVNSMVYEALLVDRDGKAWPAKLFGVDSISAEGHYCPDAKTLQAFPGLKVDQVKREGGEIELLVGMEMVAAHPTEIATVGNQRLLKSKFGSGKMLVGQVAGGLPSVLNAHAVHF